MRVRTCSGAVVWEPAVFDSQIAGTGAYGASGDDGNALRASFRNPVAVLFMPSGDLIIADAGSNALRVVANDTGIVTTLVQTLPPGSSRLNGTLLNESDVQRLAINVTFEEPLWLATRNDSQIIIVVDQGASQVSLARWRRTSQITLRA